MRAPKDVFLQNVLKEMAVPLAQTSANISGKPPARNVEEILLYFNAAEHQPDLVVDGGAREGEPSTVLDLSVAKPVVLREGAVSPETVFRWYTYFNG
ncbi:MAG: Sua5/YciO/YrdC/YwlC family protein, partial [Candidatus Wolfebacteria bacterium]|nr:Sua5/YciO/YrdC/YwlC family protein [Candidatus Wolfebacteria bacterium]